MAVIPALRNLRKEDNNIQARLGSQLSSKQLWAIEWDHIISKHKQQIQIKGQKDVQSKETE